MTKREERLADLLLDKMLDSGSDNEITYWLGFYRCLCESALARARSYCVEDVPSETLTH